MTNGITAESGDGTSSKVLIARLVAGVLLVNLFIIALTWISIHQSKIQYEESAALNTQNLSRISAEYLHGVIDKIDLAMVVVADEIQRETVRGGIDAKSLNSFIARKKTNLLEIDTVRISDAEGKIRFAAGDAAGEPENIADLEYFIKLRDTPNVKLVFSELNRGGSRGEWNVKLARRLNRLDGSFAGVLLGTIRPEYLLKVFASINLGKDGSIALGNKDLSLVARYSRAEGIVTAPPGEKSVSDKLKETVESGQNNKTYKAINPVDGIERTYTFREISDGSLFVNVGLATRDYLAAWHSENAKILTVVFLFFLMSLFISWYFYSNWVRVQLIFKAHRDSEESFWAVFDNALVGSMLLTPEGQIVKVNLMMENLIGYMGNELESLNIKEITFPDDYEIDRDLYQSMLEGWRKSYQIEKRFVSNYGTVIWGMLSVSVVRDNSGNPRYVVCMIEDISASKGAEEQLKFQNTHDGMTGLRNRAYFDGEFSRMQLGLSFPVTVIIIDLDGLKQVNDLQGHEIGDRLIMAASAVMREAFQENELVARIGGDEFAILLPETNEEKAGLLVERLRECQASFNENEKKLPVRFSIGTATAHSSAQLSKIWKQADDRMYAEKALHKSGASGPNSSIVISDNVSV
ncbi:MAG: diguanylate cyclase [Desulfuromonadaceae bacterium]|nr:diguanylate cyclase [Desulfuromonadaceae bacterium]